MRNEEIVAEVVRLKEQIRQEIERRRTKLQNDEEEDIEVVGAADHALASLLAWIDGRTIESDYYSEEHPCPEA